MINPRYIPGDRVKRALTVGYQYATVLNVGTRGLVVLVDGVGIRAIPRTQCDPRTLRVVARPARLSVPSDGS